MPLFWKYIFMDPVGIAEITLYAESEVEARKQYMEMYNVEAKALVRRENW